MRLSHSGDGLVHLGDYVMLENEGTGGCLATSLVPEHPLVCLQQESTANYSVAKCVFRLMPLSSTANPLGSTLTYGQ